MISVGAASAVDGDDDDDGMSTTVRNKDSGE